jgi:hypothetical protein
MVEPANTTVMRLYCGRAMLSCFQRQCVGEMLRRCNLLAMRMPKGRRPKERSWELLNGRNLGMREGGQNYRSWALVICVVFSIGFYEIYLQWLRLVNRGDTCAACESTRRRFRARLQQTQDTLGT